MGSGSSVLQQHVEPRRELYSILLGNSHKKLQNLRVTSRDAASLSCTPLLGTFVFMGGRVEAKSGWAFHCCSEWYGILIFTDLNFIFNNIVFKMQLLRNSQELNPMPSVVCQIMLFKGQGWVCYPWIASAVPGWLQQREPVDTATSHQIPLILCLRASE